MNPRNLHEGNIGVPFWGTFKGMYDLWGTSLEPLISMRPGLPVSSLKSSVTSRRKSCKGEELVAPSWYTLQ